MSDNKGPVRTFVSDHTIGAALITGIFVLTTGVVTTIIAHSGGSGSPPPTAPGSTATTPASRNFDNLTIEDTTNGGVWLLGSPTAHILDRHGRRPVDALRWIPNGTIASIGCAQTGATYRVIIYSMPTHWRWWAKLRDGGYVPMAAFKETHADGSQGFLVC